jgi:hypothetical protein
MDGVALAGRQLRVLVAHLFSSACSKWPSG